MQTLTIVQTLLLFGTRAWANHHLCGMCAVILGTNCEMTRGDFMTGPCAALGSRNTDLNVRTVVAVMAPSASNAAQACPAQLRDSTSQLGDYEQNNAAQTSEFVT